MESKQYFFSKEIESFFKISVVSNVDAVQRQNLKTAYYQKSIQHFYCQKHHNKQVGPNFIFLNQIYGQFGKRRCLKIFLVNFFRNTPIKIVLNLFQFTINQSQTRCAGHSCGYGTTNAQSISTRCGLTSVYYEVTMICS